jgi:hypothetical protein
MLEINNDSDAIKIFIQALLSMLSPTEGVVVDVDGKIEDRVIVWKRIEEGCEPEIVITKAPEEHKKMDLTKGHLVWVHDTKEECINAIIDDYVIQKEIDGLTCNIKDKE